MRASKIDKVSQWEEVGGAVSWRTGMENKCEVRGIARIPFRTPDPFQFPPTPPYFLLPTPTPTLHTRALRQRADDKATCEVEETAVSLMS